MRNALKNGKVILEVLANTVLFLSGFILLSDFAPPDWSPERARQKQAVAKLMHNRVIVVKANPAPGLTVDLSSSKDGGVFDAEAVDVLKNVIRKHSSYAETIPWNRVVGIGYNAMRMPMGSGKTIEGLHGLYVTALPTNSTSRELENFPVGMLDDLDKWLNASHQRSVTLWAGLLLAIGFFLQVGLSVSEFFGRQEPKLRGVAASE